ncbi:MAG: hypothetical protein KatS3mg113_1136 [Planctomycetaceae bacterium]|nr:MAG: hypothetical protein KatS3mg113_1136 [Planctomycetaceae bacterium]
MAENQTPLRQIVFFEAFPWLKIGYALGCGLAPQSVGLAWVALTLSLWFQQGVALLGPPDPQPQHDPTLWNMLRRQLPPVAAPLRVGTMPTQDVEAPGQPRSQALWIPWRPWLDVADGVFRLMAAPRADWRYWIGWLMSMLIWSAAGIGLVRSACLQFGRQESCSFREILRFGVTRCTRSFSALVIPAGFMLLLAVLANLLLLPALWMAVMPVWTWLISPLVFLFITISAMLLLTMVVLWPWILAAIAADDSDAFDAFSRAYSLITSRFWSWLFLLILAAGELYVLSSIIGVVHQAVMAWQRTCFGVWLPPEVVKQLEMTVGWWVHQVSAATLISLMWSLIGVIYLFLREAVDGQPWHELGALEQTFNP